MSGSGIGNTVLFEVNSIRGLLKLFSFWLGKFKARCLDYHNPKQ